MPVYRSHNVFEVLRGIKAFLSIGAGITRDEAQGTEDLERELRAQTAELQRDRQQLRRQEKELQRLRGPEASTRTGKTGNINPENIIWILGSPRTGSTWLAQILGDIRGYAMWREPFFGVVLAFRQNLAKKDYVKSDQFLLGNPFKDVWTGSMRRLFLDVGEAKFPNISLHNHLVVKEPNGSMSAPLIMEIFPESKLVFIVRDSRDVVASLLDAAREGSWYGYDRYEASAVEATRTDDRWNSEGRSSEEEFVEQLARNYIANISAAKEAYDHHPVGSKALIRYEDLREDTLGCVARLSKSLGIEIDAGQLEHAVEKNSWEKISEEKKGKGKFHRKATPGSYREDLTPEQIEIVSGITAPLLAKFYPK